MDEIIKNYGSKIMSHLDSMIQGSTPTAPLWNIEHKLGHIGQASKPKQVKWNYIDGCMITALLDLYDFTKQQHILDFCQEFVSHYIDDTGNILGYKKSDFNIDDINGGRNLLTLFELSGKTKFKLACDKLYQQVQEQPRTIEGNFFHKGIYPSQVWLDGLYMGQVFYAMYKKHILKSCDFDDTFEQFRNVHNIMFDKNKKLYYHGYDSTKQIFWADKKTGLSPSFWLRSNGWLLCALVDTIQVIGVTTAKVNELINQLNELLDGIMQYRDEGMFYQVIDKKDERNYLETSGSSMVAYACLKASRLGLRPHGAQEGKNIFKAICDKYLEIKDNKMSLCGINLVSGLGPYDNLRRNGTFEYYISEPIVCDDAKGIMPFVLAYIEILRQSA
jgi:unsaturated rhamnogalacturonyl hydrolase